MRGSSAHHGMRGWPRIPVAIRLAEPVGLGRKEGESSAGLARFSLTESDTRRILDVVALCVDCAQSAFLSYLGMCPPQGAVYRVSVGSPDRE